MHQYQLQQKLSPTYKEILEGLGMRSLGNLSRYLKDLKAKQYIDFIPGSHRDIKILNKEGWLNG